MMLRDVRKESLRAGKNKMESDHKERERVFVERLDERHQLALEALSEQHQEKLANMISQFRKKRHQLIRDKESAKDKLEERHIQERHQLKKQQIKEAFYLQRQQMLARHAREVDHLRRAGLRRSDLLARQQQSERRALPKRIRAERKARELMFRESLRIGQPLPGRLSTADGDKKEQLSNFHEQEGKRYKGEEHRLELKHKRKMEELKALNESAVKELEQLHNEKCRTMLDHEDAKLRSVEEQYLAEVQEWRQTLEPRRLKLEEELAADQEYQPESSPAAARDGFVSKVTLSNGRSSLGRASTVSGHSQ
ncbi:STE20-like serine/threonine-protein kinase [Pollicipes pollicipes]|uniref:STE20-like serine/threonine-protein kinase n=1 Tax=Pollicipes pollicipes TaxID=41117 RepID=UPI00188532CD|nr:STE20-like serine/threonine-protein kinase [Pollicipes pollicipes]